MEYIEMPEWKELKKEKKYKEAADKLMYEIAVNLMMVHNKYSDVKYDPYTDDAVAYGTIWYARDSSDEYLSQIDDFFDISLKLSRARVDYCYEPQNKTLEEYKEIFKRTQKIKRMVIDVYNVRNKKNNW